jgi:nicotinate-nucleotide adenylyltransferase
MKIGFFGGSFDPPHNGHRVVAAAAAEAFHLERVLLAPVASQPLKRDGAEAPFEDRLRMIELLCAGSAVLEATDIDGPRSSGEPNYTIDTIARLERTLNSATEIFVIVGADAFQTLRQWRDFEELLRVAQWIVVSRPHALEPAWAQLQLTAAQLAHVHTLNGISEMVSATSVRERLHAGESCQDLLPASVLKYIREHHLYGT